jgi:hypothetical protein
MYHADILPRYHTLSSAMASPVDRKSNPAGYLCAGRYRYGIYYVITSSAIFRSSIAGEFLFRSAFSGPSSNQVP